MPFLVPFVACSGPGALQVIAENQGYSQLLWAATVGLSACSVLLWIRRWRTWWLIAPSVLASVIHPAWTTSATRGDCGSFMYSASVFAACIAGAFLALQIVFYSKQEGFRRSQPAGRPNAAEPCRESGDLSQS